MIPNNDEKCTWGWSFDDALRAMVFTLAAVCTILLCIGCIRHARRSLDIAPVCLVLDIQCKILHSLTATKPTAAISRPRHDASMYYKDGGRGWLLNPPSMYYKDGGIDGC